MIRARAARDAEGQLVVVQNFVEELRRRAPR
jgi:hypothetical protein